VEGEGGDLRKCIRYAAYRWRVPAGVWGPDPHRSLCGGRGACRRGFQADPLVMLGDRRARWPGCSTSGPITARGGDPGGSY
jgi:hypothetical protein